MLRAVAGTGRVCLGKGGGLPSHLQDQSEILGRTFPPVAASLAVSAKTHTKCFKA